MTKIAWSGYRSCQIRHCVNDRKVSCKLAGKNHDNCNRTDVPPGSTLTVTHAERSLPESYAAAASTRRTNITESDQPATTQDTTQTSNSPTLPSDEKWTKKTPRRPKPNTGSKNPVDKKTLGKLLGAERIIKAVYYDVFFGTLSSLLDAASKESSYLTLLGDFNAKHLGFPNKHCWDLTVSVATRLRSLTMCKGTNSLFKYR